METLKISDFLFSGISSCTWSAAIISLTFSLEESTMIQTVSHEALFLAACVGAIIPVLLGWHSVSRGQDFEIALMKTFILMVLSGYTSIWIFELTSLKLAFVLGMTLEPCLSGL